MSIKYNSVFFLLILPIFLYAQSQNLRFELISVEQGLSHERVRQILHDSQGYMWFGTGDGLNKYDGYQFTIYRHNPEDSTSLGSNVITDLYEDHSGNLWIGTFAGGLNKFDRDKEIFIRYKYNRTDTTSIKSNDIKEISEYRYEGKDVLWVGTGWSLHKMDIATQKFKHYPHTEKGFPYSLIESMVVDSAGIVWFGTSEGGLHKFNPRTEQYTHYQHDPENPQSLSDNRIISLCLDRAGVLWIGTNGGRLNKFDSKKELFTCYQIVSDNPYRIKNNNILGIHEAQGGNLWIATVRTGLNIFDRQKEQFTRFINVPGDPMSLSDNAVIGINEDRSGVMWLGTYNGLNKIDPGKSKFSVYNNIPGNPNSLSSSIIGPILESTYKGKKFLWISTKKGLNKIDRASGEYNRYVNDPNNAKSIPSNLGISLFEDRSGILWIGTMGDGLIKYDREKEQFTQYYDPDNLANQIKSIYEDKYGILWISTRIGGLNKFDPKSGLFTRVGNTMQTNQVLEDKSGSFWVATYRGLKKLNRETEEFITYWHNPEKPNSLSSNNVNVIYESFFDEKEVLWIGTDRGLNIFDHATGSFKHFTTDDGLPNNKINSILEDNRGNLWLGTSDGLSKFNPNNNKFRNYDVSDGLPGNHFGFMGCFKSEDGELFFGTSKGAFSFYPDRLKDNSNIPDIAITEFRIFNEKVRINVGADEENQNEYTLAKHISQLKEIKLSYKENIFSFEFAALDYYSPQKNHYAYKMEGIDRDWVYTDASRRFATYTNLDPGEYTFRVKGSNNDGLWNEEGTSLKVIITPPWWRSNLAYMFYVFLFGFIVFGVWRFQINRMRMKQQMEMQNFEAEKLREVDKLKSRFFANISHEFRTPLTLIKGPVKQMLAGQFTENIKDQFRMILRNSDRLLGLINQILDLSKLESGEIKIKVSEIDLVKHLKGLVLSFSSLAERKKITLKLNTKNNLIVGYVDIDKLEKIVTNLLSNAFKFTPEEGKIICEFGIRNVDFESESKSKIQNPKSKMLFICISNTGAGIPLDQIEKIFDRFYQAEDKYKKDSEGSGIGLALTKELVEVCRGEITVSSIPNKTTTFVVSLPIAKEFFKEDEIVDSSLTIEEQSEISTAQSSSIIEDQVSSIQNSRQHRLHPEDSSGLIHPGINQHRVARDEKRDASILIVEDNPDVTSYICSFMENEYRIITAENGKIGLKKTLDKYPDLVISDVMMPEMDGFELCQKIKTDERISHIPVILLTAKADLESKIDGLEFGADDYVTKPFEARELQIRSKNLIEQRRKLREKFSQLIDLRPEDIAASSMDEQLLERLLVVFENHIEEPDFNLEKLANEIGMSRTHLNRKIHALTNLSTREFIRTIRLQRAAGLLRSASGTVSEIAYKVGFNNLSYFSKAFRKHFGKLPSDFSRKK